MSSKSILSILSSAVQDTGAEDSAVESRTSTEKRKNSTGLEEEKESSAFKSWRRSSIEKIISEDTTSEVRSVSRDWNTKFTKTRSGGIDSSKSDSWRSTTSRSIIREDSRELPGRPKLNVGWGSGSTSSFRSKLENPNRFYSSRSIRGCLSTSDILSIKEQVAKVLESAALSGNPSLLFIVKDKPLGKRFFLEPSSISHGSNQMRKFLIDCFHFLQANTSEFFLLLGKKQEMKQAFHEILNSKFDMDSIDSSKDLDFQTILLPLLFILSHPRLEASPLITQTNLLLSMAKSALPSFFPQFLIFASTTLTAKSINTTTHSTAQEKTSFLPVSFCQIFYPMVKFLEILFRRFEETARGTANQSNVDQLEKLLLKWKSEFENGHLVSTQESKNGIEIVFEEFKRVKTLVSGSMDITATLKRLREKEAKLKTLKLDDDWKDPPLEPPSGLFDNDQVDYRNIRLIPTMEEILFNGEIYLPGNLPFSSSAHWLPPGPERLLDTHFRLLRMDMVASIRLSIKAFLQHLEEGKNVKCGRFRKHFEYQVVNLMVYTNAKVKQRCFDKFGGLCCEITFDLPSIPLESRARFWEKCLQKDALLCFVYKHPEPKDSFTLRFAVIVKRDKNCESNPSFLTSKLVISFNEQDYDALELNFNNIYLIEFKEFLFESYRPILTALQKMKGLDLPFTSILCPSAPPSQRVLTVNLPYYLIDTQQMYSFKFLEKKSMEDSISEIEINDISDEDEFSFTKSFSLNAFDPREDDFGAYSKYISENTSLDLSQSRSLLGALTNNVCCIQGPPGSGKTYIGVQIVKALLQVPSENARILVMSLTNHALDQFLTHLSEAGIENMLRISSTPNEALRRYDWYSKSKVNFHSFYLRDLRSRIKELQQEISNSLENHFFDVSLDDVWHYISLKEKDIAEQIKWPFISEKDEFPFLKFWLDNKNPPLQRKKKKNSKKKAYRNTEYETFSSFAETGDDFDASKKKLLEDLSDFTLTDDFFFETSEKSQSSDEQLLISDDQGDSQSNDIVLPDLDKDNLAWENIEHCMPASSKDSSKSIFESLETLNTLIEKLDEAQEDAIATNAKQESTISVWDIEVEERKGLYASWVDTIIELRNQSLEHKHWSLTECISRHQELLSVDLSDQMEGSQIIGITTTRASKNIEALKAWGPSIILCEEAGEILESHILASLSRSVAHLILIGDHKQLRPRITEYDLSVESRKGKQYRLDVSLFERLMDPMCHLPLYTLQEQRRMKPVISQFIRKTIYPELLDGKNVLNRKPILGMQKDVFFLTHNHPQNSDEELLGGLGHSNLFEAEMIVAFIEYLLKQGYSPNQIVVLTPYLFQLRLLRRKISNLDPDIFTHTRFKRGSDTPTITEKTPTSELRVSSVDNFQGEEADIILISLVRSTFDSGSDYGIGFLKIENRVNVLLSRAREGMYLFGNGPLLSKHSKMWKTVLETMEEQSLIDTKLPIVCQNHPNEVRFIVNGEDFRTLAPAGGCLQNCNFRLECGHACAKACHSDDRLHKYYKCRKLCEFRFPECDHRCPKLCYELCNRCELIVDDFTLPTCGHVLKSPKCYITLKPEIIKCDKKVEYTRDCGHTIHLKCYQDVETFKKENPCKIEVEYTRKCGHKIKLPCSKNSNDYMAINPCTESMVLNVILPKCGHKFSNPKCHELNNLNEIKCPIIVSKLLPCDHSIQLKCFEDIKYKQCKSLCGKVSECGHVCKSQCSSCVNLFGSRRHSRNYCTSTCGKQLPCFHQCKIQCSQHSSSGKACPTCQQPCIKTACIHGDCKASCSETCTICLETCAWHCVHQGNCPFPCGYPCMRLPCDLQCQKNLSCGHRCPSVCGEPCPTSTYCPQCSSSSKLLDLEQKELLQSYSLSLKTNPLIFLKCGHFFPIQNLDLHFGLDKYYEKNADKWLNVKLPRKFVPRSFSCPTCCYPVRIKEVYRYSRVIKYSLLQRADVREISKICNNLNYASTLISNLEHAQKDTLLQQNEVIDRSITERAENFFSSSVYKLAFKILDSSIQDSFPNVPVYSVLHNFPQYPSMDAQYFVVKARLQKMKLSSMMESCPTFSTFGKFHLTYTQALEYYQSAEESFCYSYADCRLLQLTFEKLYLDAHYYTYFLHFLCFGEFSKLHNNFQQRELYSVAQKVYYLIQYMRRTYRKIQTPNTSYLKPISQGLFDHFRELLFLFKEKLGSIEMQQKINQREFRYRAGSVIKAMESIKKFKMPFSGDQVNFFKKGYFIRRCIYGHFYFISLDKLIQRQNERCEECGSELLRN